MLVPPLALRIGQGRFVVRIREIRLLGRLLQQTQEMLCVLIEILGRNGVASGSGFSSSAHWSECGRGDGSPLV